MAINLFLKGPDIPLKRVTGYMSGEANGFQIPGSYSQGVLGAAQTLKQNVVVAAGVMTITLDFAPKYVKVQNVTSRISKEWYEGMNLTDSLLTVAAGTKTLVTTSGVLIAGAVTGVAPVQYNPANTVTITFGTDSLVVDNDTFVWEIKG
mgnify:CR=1 FL=1